MSYAFLSRATRRYLLRLAPTMAVYVLFVFLSKWSFQRFHPTGLSMCLLAILPALPMIGSLAIVALYLAEESDEFERFILIQSVLWGLGGPSPSAPSGALSKNSPKHPIIPLSTPTSSSGFLWPSPECLSA